MSTTPPVRPRASGAGKREGGCTLVITNSDEKYFSVTDNAQTAVDKINAGRHMNKLVHFERNDYTSFSGQSVWVDPNMVVKVF